MWNCFLGLCSLQTFPPNFLSFPCILGLETLTHSHVKGRAGSQEWHEGWPGLPSRWPCSGGSGWAEPSKGVPSEACRCWDSTGSPCSPALRPPWRESSLQPSSLPWITPLHPRLPPWLPVERWSFPGGVSCDPERQRGSSRVRRNQRMGLMQSPP